MSKGKILIIEDEESIRDVIRFVLENNGFTEIETAPDGETGIQCAKTFLPHLILFAEGIDRFKTIKRVIRQKLCI